jgi:uncharacterized protein (DUF1810 family)
MDHDLERFVRGQQGVYEGALEELRRGGKHGHWMWFVLPQLEGLGRSPMAQRYGIRSLAEARAYLDHPVLGTRLRACFEALLGVEGRTASQIMGEVDAMKLRSSATLFHRAAPEEPLFRRVLERYFDGIEDPATDARL